MKQDPQNQEWKLYSLLDVVLKCNQYSLGYSTYSSHINNYKGIISANVENVI